MKSINSKNNLLLDVEEELKKLESGNGILKLVDSTISKDDPEINANETDKKE